MSLAVERTSANYRQIPERLGNRQPFKGNSMSATIGEGDALPTGRLAPEFRGLLRSAGPVYAVYSHGTPIAWVTASGDVVIPDVRYSVTTTRQQNLCGAWL